MHYWLLRPVKEEPETVNNEESLKIEKYNENANEISEQTSKLAIGSAEVSAFVDKLAQSIKQDQGHVTQISESCDQLSSLTDQVNLQVQETTEFTRSARNTSDEGRLSMEGSTAVMSTLKDPIDLCGFLCFIFVRGKIRWSEKSLCEFKRRIRLFTGRSWFVSMDYRYKKLAEYVRGWMNYYGISEYYRPIPEIDDWLRRRIRMCYWKQWRYTRTKVRNLLKLGTHKRKTCHSHCTKPKGTVASFTDSCSTNRNDQQMAL